MTPLEIARGILSTGLTHGDDDADILARAVVDLSEENERLRNGKSAGTAAHRGRGDSAARSRRKDRQVRLTGLFRLSYNRAGAAPLIWSIAPLDKDGVPIVDIAVAGFSIDGARVASVYQPKATPDDEDGKPSAYLVVEGTLTIDASGVGAIRPEAP